MMIDCEIRKLLFKAVAQRVIASADELTDLDRAIGDGDHGTNMRRGFEAVLSAVDELSARNLGESLKGVGTTLVMKVGGASAPSTERCSCRSARRFRTRLRGNSLPMRSRVRSTR